MLVGQVEDMAAIYEIWDTVPTSSIEASSPSSCRVIIRLDGSNWEEEFWISSALSDLNAKWEATPSMVPSMKSDLDIYSFKRHINSAWFLAFSQRTIQIYSNFFYSIAFVDKLQTKTAAGLDYSYISAISKWYSNRGKNENCIINLSFNVINNITVIGNMPQLNRLDVNQTLML